MDSKVSAKSKRAHSLHGNRKWSTHANSNAKNSSQSGATSDKNQSRERNRRSRATPNLPSNWDRYRGDEVESDPDNPLADIDRTGRAYADVAAPKSKGADFKELISQAQSDAHAHSKFSADSFSSLGDVLPDFYQGSSAMLSVRGKSLLSWCADDNFDVDENSTSGYEASFLSIDLHALAAQLEKMDISKRLFIEPDLLPANLFADVSEESSSKGGGLDTLESHGEHVVNEKKLNNLNEVMLSTATSIGSSRAGGIEIREETSGSSSFSVISGQVVKSDPFDQEGFDESTVPISLDVPANLKEKDSRFEAAAAEAELDMLLNSFSETNLLDSGSSVMKPRNGFPVAVGGSRISSKESMLTTATQPIVQVADISRHTSTAVALDDAIDNLLGERSISFNQRNDSLSQSGTGVPKESMLTMAAQPIVQVTGISRHTSAGVALDDAIDDLLGEKSIRFNQKNELLSQLGTTVPMLTMATQPIQITDISKQTSASVALDDAIDDLLGERSVSFNQKNEPLSQSGTAVPVSHPANSSYSGAQALDDFDSWMDSL